MPRWKQIDEIDPKTGRRRLVPIDQEAARRDASAAVHGDIDSFVSPIDGTVISDRKQYREHCEKHNVVPAAEFNKEFLERKARERADFYEGRHSREEKHRRKQEIYNNWIAAERRNGW